jgi:hypothetical protein
MRHLACLIIVVGLATADIAVSQPVRDSAHRSKTQHRAAPAIPMGPLRVSVSNPRYFSGPAGDLVYLTGSHTWNNLQDGGVVGGPPIAIFDYDAYLDFLRARNHNFIRLWSFQGFSAGHHWHAPPQYFEPLPYTRIGRDSKFDLERFDQAYFDRLRSRVAAARNRGLYVAIMLFQGWSVEARAAWRGHPFNVQNNVNGVDGDRDKDGSGEEIYTLAYPAVTALQRAYIRKVVETVNHLENVLYEVGNEIGDYSAGWQYHIASYLTEYQAGKPRQHPVGMTAMIPGQGKAGEDTPLFRSPAHWISPARARAPRDWVSDPPPADGRKVILSDTDHFDPGSRTHAWVWKTFLRGHNPILMDDPKNSDATREAARAAMGHTLVFARRVDLTSMIPREELASSGYCLADEGAAYLVYVPSHPTGSRLQRLYAWFMGLFRLTVTVDLSAASGPLAVEWFDPRTGRTIAGGMAEGKARRTFRAPFHGDAVLYIVDGDAASGGASAGRPSLASRLR